MTEIRSSFLKGHNWSMAKLEKGMPCFAIPGNRTGSGSTLQAAYLLLQEECRPQQRIYTCLTCTIFCVVNLRLHGVLRNATSFVCLLEKRHSLKNVKASLICCLLWKNQSLQSYVTRGLVLGSSFVSKFNLSYPWAHWDKLAVSSPSVNLK